MQKLVPGTINVYITDDKHFCSIDGKELSLNIKDNKVELFRCGRMDWYDIDKVYLCSWFEVPVFVNWDDVLFIPISIAGKACQYRPIYLRPYCYDMEQQYRICPEYPRYAVSANGDCYNTVTKRILPVHKCVNGYTRVTVYSPATGDYAEVMTHKLVALCWVMKNITNPKCTSINHINGIRSDNRAQNLSWCTPKYNLEDAKRRTKSIKPIIGRVRDIVTGEIYVFRTYVDMCDFLGIKGGHNAHKLRRFRVDHLFKNKYEMRLAGDERPWILTPTSSIEDTRRKYIITVEEPEGTTRVFRSCIQLKSFYGVRTTIHDTAGVIKVFKERFPGFKIHCVDLLPKTTFQLKNIKTGEINEFPSITSIANHTGLTADRVYSLVARNGALAANNLWVARRTSSDPWPEIELITTSMQKYSYKVVDTITGSVEYFKRLRDVIFRTNLPRYSVRRMIENPNPLDKYQITFESNYCPDEGGPSYRKVP